LLKCVLATAESCVYLLGIKFNLAPVEVICAGAELIAVAFVPVGRKAGLDPG